MFAADASRAVARLSRWLTGRGTAHNDVVVFWVGWRGGDAAAAHRRIEPISPLAMEGHTAVPGSLDTEETDPCAEHQCRLGAG